MSAIAPTIGTFTVPAKNYGDAAFALTAPTSNSAGAFSYTSSNTSVATISGTTVTIVGAGSSTITATQAANGNYTSGTATATFTVNARAVTLTGTRTYDGTATVSYTILTVSNKVGADNVTVASGSGTLASATVGSRAITSLGTLTLGGTSASNYTLTGATGSVTIGNAPLSITAKDQTKCYGIALTIPGTEFTQVGLLNSDAVTSVTLSSPGTASNAAINSYTITASAAQGTGLGNYTITYNTGTLSVVGPSVSAGSALADVCKGGTSAALGGSVGGTASGGTWSDGGAGGTFSNPNDISGTTYTVPFSYIGTSVTLTLTTSGGSCTSSATASKNLTVDATCQVVTLTQPTALSAVIKEDDVTTICAGKTTTIRVDVSGGTLPYKINNVVQSGPGPFIITVAPATNTTYDYQNVVVTDAHGCTSSTTGSVAIVVQENYVSFTGLASAYCVDAGTVTLSGVPLDAVWGSFSGSVVGSISNNGNGTASFSPSFAGVGTHTITYTYTIPYTVCTNYSVQTVTINPLPVAGAITGGNAVCMGSTLALSAHATGTGTLSYTWASSDITKATVSNTGVVTPKAAGTTDITYTVTDGSSTQCTKTSAAFTVTVNALPSGSLTATETSGTPNDNKICKDASVTFTALPGTFSNYNFKLNGTTSLQNGSANTYTGAFPNSAVVTVEATANSCTNVIGSVSITVDALPACSITGLTTVTPNSTVTYTAPPGMASYDWSLSADDIANGYTLTSPTNEQSVTVNTIPDGCNSQFTLALIFTNAYGCSSTCSQLVTVEDTEPPVVTKGSILSCYHTVEEAEAAAFGATTYTDNTPGLTAQNVTYNTVISGCTAEITILVTDNCNNESSVKYTTRIDNTPPALTSTPTLGTKNINTCKPTQLDAEAAFSALEAKKGYTDNCDGLVITPTLNSTAVTGTNSSWTVTYTYSVMDGCGNTLSGQSYSNSGGDRTPPVLANVPADITISCNIPAVGTPTATDGCDASPVVNFLGGVSTKGTDPLLSSYYNYIITRTWDATDASGNHSLVGTQVITVHEVTAPVTGTVTQPLCSTSTGSVALSGLPSSAWTVTASPSSLILTGSSATATFTGLPANTTQTFTVTVTSSGCTSAASNPVIFNAQPSTPAAPTVSVVQPTCLSSNGSVAITSSTSGLTFSTDGTNYAAYSAPYVVAANVSYSITAKNASGCVSTAATGTMGAQPSTPTALSLAGSTICVSPGNNGTIASTTSVNGISYQLYNSGNTPVQTAQTGTGSALTWSGLTVGTGYYVIATNAATCTATSGTADVGTSPSPSAAGSITGTSTVTQGQSGIAYSVPAIANASAYVWAYTGTGATFSGSGTNITISFGATATSGNVTVLGRNSCGDGGQASFAVTVVTNTKTTALDGSWNDPATWSPLGVPNALQNVSVTKAIRVDNAPTAVCLGLSIGTGSSVTVYSGMSLTVNGNLSTDATSNNLVVESGGSLITLGSVTGKATVKSDISTNRWHFISAPVDTLSGSFKGKYLQNYDETNFKYNDIISMTLPLTAMKGFALWGDPGFTHSYKGTLNTGSKSISGLTYTAFTGFPDKSGWNLVGNPYPSSVDWDAVSGWTKTNLNNAIYVENNGGWATYVSGLGANYGTQYIAPGQGFMIRVSGSGGGSLAVNNNARVHNATTFFKRASAGASNFVRLEVSGNGYKDEALVRFMPEATSEFDNNYDATKLFGYIDESAQIYTLGSTPMTINSLPECNEVPLGIHAITTGSYTIAATELVDIPFVSLEDIKTGLFTDLLSGSYTFTFGPGENEVRFMLHFGTTNLPDPAKAINNIYSYQQTAFIDLKDQEKGTIFVYNAAGQLVRSQVASKGMNEVKLSNTGIYVVKVITAKSTIVKKIWIE